MQNPFPYSLDNKRYHTWNYHLQQTFDCKVGKAALDAGMTCPNIDGTKGTGGCIYCSPRGSGDFAGDPACRISQQYLTQRQMIRRKWPSAKCIAYFQAHSNTYASAEKLRKLYEEALACPDVVGLCIATRADLLPPDVLKLLRELNQRTWLLVELGLQTVHDTTARLLNRCHSYQDFLDGYGSLQRAGVRACIHIINGLPGETREMMLDTVGRVGQLGPHSVKIHMLHVLKETKLATMYHADSMKLPEMEAYIQLICDQLELLPPEVVVQRLTGDAPADYLITPQWVRDKRRILNGIDRELARRGSWQGRKFDCNKTNLRDK